MKTIKSTYISGSFTVPSGSETVEIISPLNGKAIATITYADQQDTKAAIRAASEALESYSKTTISERISIMQRIHNEILKRIDDLIEATIHEYGAPRERAKWANLIAATTFLDQIKILNGYEFEKTVGSSKVIMEPVGIAVLFTPWNATAGSIAVKLSAALAAGCTVVLKPSEFGSWQAEIMMECLHAAGLPKGVVNMVNGRGELISAVVMESPEVTKISFTGSTVVGKIIAKEALSTMKRVTLELGGKSANVILEDADLDKAIPMALQAAFMNNGQACIAGTRLLVPESRLKEVKDLILQTAPGFTVGSPLEGDYKLGPLASQKQYERIQQFIQAGIDEGAELLCGGLGHPEGLEEGFYVRPTIFIQVNNQMRIAKEEIFGPVLSVISYKTPDEAIAIANDTEYGLMAYVSGENKALAVAVASKLKAGRVLINTLRHDPIAPFGGYKNSGIGRENGILGLEEYLEAKTLIID